MKKLFLTLALAGLALPALIQADDGSKTLEEEGTPMTWKGEITAIEEDRDSITVASEEGEVRMFEVSASRKAGLTVGDNVRITFLDRYEWPLPVRSLSVMGADAAK